MCLEKTLPKPENKNKNLKIPDQKSRQTSNENLVERHI